MFYEVIRWGSVKRERQVGELYSQLSHMLFTDCSIFMAGYSGLWLTVLLNMFVLHDVKGWGGFGLTLPHSFTFDGACLCFYLLDIWTHNYVTVSLSCVKIASVSKWHVLWHVSLGHRLEVVTSYRKSDSVSRCHLKINRDKFHSYRIWSDRAFWRASVQQK